MVVVNSSFHIYRISTKIICNLGKKKTLKNFHSPVPRQKSLKNIGFKGCQIISLPGSSTCHGVALTNVQAIQVHYRLQIKHVANTQSYFKTGLPNHQSQVVLSSYTKK